MLESIYNERSDLHSKAAEERTDLHSKAPVPERSVETKGKKRTYVIIGVVIFVVAAAIGTVFLSRGNSGNEMADAEKQIEVVQPMEEPVEEVEIAAPSGAVEYDGHYYLIVNEAGTWSEAKELCEEEAGHLVTITSQAEQEFIEEYINNEGMMKHYWLGGTDEEEEGAWKWITGEPWDYTHWCTGQPNNTEYVDTVHGQDYLEIQATRGDQGAGEYLTWTDICDSGVAYNTNTGASYEEAPDYNSTKYYGYICEWDE